MDYHVELLTFLVIIHAIFSISGSLFVLSFSLGYNFLILDVFALFIAISFVLFRRCIMIDIYNYFKGEINDEKLPDRAKDNYPRNLFKKILGGKISKRDLTELRLDILSNLKPFENCDEKNIKKFFGRKTEYIVINSIITIILLVKYKLNFLIPLFFVWVLYVFRT